MTDEVCTAIEPLIPLPLMTHPLGDHGPQVLVRLCDRGILSRLITGHSWIGVDAILGYQVPDTTSQARRVEWIAAGVFDLPCEYALHTEDTSRSWLNGVRLKPLDAIHHLVDSVTVTAVIVTAAVTMTVMLRPGRCRHGERTDRGVREGPVGGDHRVGERWWCPQGWSPSIGPTLRSGNPLPIDHRPFVDRRRRHPGDQVPDTTSQVRRVEWIAAGVFDLPCEYALHTENVSSYRGVDPQ